MLHASSPLRSGAKSNGRHCPPPSPHRLAVSSKWHSSEARSTVAKTRWSLPLGRAARPRSRAISPSSASFALRPLVRPTAMRRSQLGRWRAEIASAAEIASGLGPSSMRRARLIRTSAPIWRALHWRTTRPLSTSSKEMRPSPVTCKQSGAVCRNDCRPCMLYVVGAVRSRRRRRLPSPAATARSVATPLPRHHAPGGLPFRVWGFGLGLGLG